jgi:hypothetical protein
MVKSEIASTVLGNDALLRRSEALELGSEKNIAELAD